MAALKNFAALAGGYGLARSAADITVADNLPAVDELMRPFARAANLPSDDSNPPNQRIASDWCADLELTMAQFRFHCKTWLRSRTALARPQSPHPCVPWSIAARRCATPWW